MIENPSEYIWLSSAGNSRQSRIQLLAFVIAIIIAAVMACFFLLVSFCGATQSQKVVLQSRINPNSASLGSLIRLPGIGISRGQAILTCRDNLTNSDADKVAFSDCNNLQIVKGIGPKTVQNVKKWLSFEQH
ncbi:MAG: helix-hairpin-helix domain-containing protein [Sedimentisphaerales bacterium]|nr:helix-hairpin-helix domain-containing protein [Sedimentisphaerales bacterium]